MSVNETSERQISAGNRSEDAIFECLRKVGKANFLSSEPSQAPSRLTFRFSEKTTRQLQLRGIDNTMNAPILKSRVNHINKN